MKVQVSGKIISAMELVWDPLMHRFYSPPRKQGPTKLYLGLILVILREGSKERG